MNALPNCKSKPLEHTHTKRVKLELKMCSVINTPMEGFVQTLLKYKFNYSWVYFETPSASSQTTPVDERLATIRIKTLFSNQCGLLFMLLSTYTYAHQTLISYKRIHNKRSNRTDVIVFHFYCDSWVFYISFKWSTSLRHQGTNLNLDHTSIAEFVYQRYNNHTKQHNNSSCHMCTFFFQKRKKKAIKQLVRYMIIFSAFNNLSCYYIYNIHKFLNKRDCLF